MKQRRVSRPHVVYPRRFRGFTIIELLVAMVIGMLLVGGISALFLSTSRSNTFQERLARLQENGRFAVYQIEADLRRATATYCSSKDGDSHLQSNEAIWSRKPMQVWAPELRLPDTGSPPMNSVATTGGGAGGRSNAAATAPYLLSARFFMQGYRCTTGTTCQPALTPANTFPSAGLAAGLRVPNSDILTVRYIRGTGWPIANAAGRSCRDDGYVEVQPSVYDDPLQFAPGDIVMIANCSGPVLLPVSALAGNRIQLDAAAMLNSPNPDSRPLCVGDPGGDARAFNFRRDFVTVSYYLAFRANDNPDAPANAGAQSLIPTLIRRENGVEQEVVRGIDQLRFTYGVQDRLGNHRFLTALQVQNRVDGSGSSISCPLKPRGVLPSINDTGAQEPGCLWRSVERIEARLLVNGMDEVGSLEEANLAYRFEGEWQTPTAATLLPSGIRHGRLPRREFVAAIAARNANH